MNQPASRRFSFSLRAMLLGMLVVSIGLGAFSWRLSRARQQANAVKALNAMDLYVSYEFIDPQPWIQVKLEPWLGKDFFVSVVEVTVPPPSRVIHSPDEGQVFWASVAACPNLKKLSVRGTGWPGLDLTTIRGLHQLEQLFVWDGSLQEEDLQVIGALTNLKGLYLWTKAKNGDLHHLRGLQKLTSLGLDSQVDDQGLLAFDRLPELQMLHLNDTQISDRGLAVLATMPKLRELRLEDTAIGSEGIKHVVHCPQLTGLQLQGTQVADEGLRYIGRCLHLKVLRLDQTKVTDAGLEHLQGLTSLTHLTLDGTSVTGSGLSHLAGRVPLESLSMGNGSKPGAATRECLPHFVKMTNLHQLEFRSSSITSEDLAAAKWPASLTSIDICVPKIDRVGLNSFAGHPNRMMIFVPDDSFSQVEIAAIQQELNCEIISRPK